MATSTTPRTAQKGPAVELEPKGAGLDSGKSDGGTLTSGNTAAPLAEPQAQVRGPIPASPEPLSETSSIPSPSSQQQSASSPDDSGALATERPVMSSSEASTSVYMVTVDNRSGIATRIDRLDEQSGGRKELSPVEYAQVFAGYCAPAMGGGDAIVQAYLQGMNDYLSARAKGA